MLKKILGDKNYLLRRYILFLIGLFVCSLGIACMTKAGIGTSPMAAVPYTLSLIVPKLSFGTWVIVVCMIQIAMQIVLLRKNTVPGEIIIQIIISFIYGYLTDFSLYLIRDIEIHSYSGQIILQITGCLVLALGIYIELIGDVGMLSGDAFIRAIARVMGKEYGNVKMIADVVMIVISVALSTVFLHQLAGVREGTVLSAVLVGMLIKKYKKMFAGFERKIFPENVQNE